MAREYDHLFKLLIIGDSGEYIGVIVCKIRQKVSKLIHVQCEWSMLTYIMN